MVRNKSIPNLVPMRMMCPGDRGRQYNPQQSVDFSTNLPAKI